MDEAHQIHNILTNIDFQNDEISKRQATRPEDSVLAESSETQAKDLNTSNETFQGPLRSMFGVAEKKLSTALNWSSNKVITESQLDRFANNQRKYRNVSHINESPTSPSASQEIEHLQVFDESFIHQMRQQDLEKWRRTTMTNKLYFLCPAASTLKGRKILQRSMPPNLQ